MAADDPGTSRGTHRAHEGEPGAPEATRVDVTEVVEVTSEGVAEVDVTEVDVAAVNVTEVTQAPVAYPQAPSAQPQFVLEQPVPQPIYPQPPAAYPQPPGGYQQPPPGYPQQPFYGWGAQPGLLPVPPQPKISLPRRTLATALALVVVAVLALGLGLVMAQPSGGSAAKHTTGAAAQDESVRAIWRTATIGQLLPASIKREGSETYIRLGINPDESCAKLPAAFTSALAPSKCAHVLSATYADRTQTVTATVGIVVVSGSVADRLRLFQAWTPDANANNEAMMPHTYPVPRTVAAQFADTQRVAWQSQASSDGTFLVYAVAGFSDGRTGPGSAAIAANSGSALSSSSPAVQVAGDLPEAIQELLASQIQDTQGGAS
ncbi:MAG TPA: hypothetical protein VFU65_15750 [Actinocrinis sp.]|nr:hypothetical protein [Actinocrinis sp.]